MPVVGELELHIRFFHAYDAIFIWSSYSVISMEESVAQYHRITNLYIPMDGLRARSTRLQASTHIVIPGFRDQ